MPIGIYLTITARTETAQELHDRLLDAVALSRTEPGNLMAVLLHDPQDPCHFAIFEIYRDEDAMQAHREAPYAREAAPIIHALFAEPMKLERLETLNWPASFSVAYPAAA